MYQVTPVRILATISYTTNQTSSPKVISGCGIVLLGCWHNKIILISFKKLSLNETWKRYPLDPPKWPGMIFLKNAFCSSKKLALASKVIDENLTRIKSLLSSSKKLASVEVDIRDGSVLNTNLSALVEPYSLGIGRAKNLNKIKNKIQQSQVCVPKLNNMHVTFKP